MIAVYLASPGVDRRLSVEWLGLGRRRRDLLILRTNGPAAAGKIPPNLARRMRQLRMSLCGGCTAYLSTPYRDPCPAAHVPSFRMADPLARSANVVRTHTYPPNMGGNLVAVVAVYAASEQGDLRPAKAAQCRGSADSSGPA